MKRFPVLFSLTVFISLSALLTSANAISYGKAANSPGSVCKKVGSGTKSGALIVKCVKVGKKLIWQKIAPTKKTTPTAKPSLSPTPKPSATQSDTPVPAKIPPAQNEYEINAKAAQWSYSFSYLIDASKTPLNSDSSHSTVLYLPQGKLVHILLKSNDVSHGFWVPGLGLDKEASPDSVTTLDITPAKIGTYPAACNIQCGRGHAGMTFSVVVVSQADYLKYLSTLKAG